MHRDKKLQIIRDVFYRRKIENLWFQILTEFADKNHDVLEIGSGSGRGKQNQEYPIVNKIVGLDLDERVMENPFLDKAHCIDAYSIDGDILGGNFDLIYSHMVVEHIDDAERFISSQISVLKDGGMILHSTVSKYYWTSLMNEFIPVYLKNFLISSLGSGREADDIFPTHYKLNSEDQVRKVCNDLNLRFEIIRQDEPPGYLRRSFLLMLIYMAIHKPVQFFIPSLRPTFIFKIFKAPCD